MVEKNTEVGRRVSTPPNHFSAGMTLPRAIPAKSGVWHSISSTPFSRAHLRSSLIRPDTRSGDSSSVISGSRLCGRSFMMHGPQAILSATAAAV